MVLVPQFNSLEVDEARVDVTGFYVSYQPFTEMKNEDPFVQSCRTGGLPAMPQVVVHMPIMRDTL